MDVPTQVYQIGTIYGLLNRWFSRNEITVCQTNEIINIPREKVIFLRDALRLFSKLEGQGFKKCSCM